MNKVHRIVLKVGSQVLTAKGRSLSQAVFDRLARELSAAKKKGYEMVIVSSGAIAAGMARLGLLEKPKTIPQKQAAAAIGQSALMWNYERAFTCYGEKVAQVLLTRDDLSNRRRYLNARNTLLTLLGLGVIPIINENDTVVVEEIKFGDNDNLSALVTSLVNADLLIILSDIDGLYDRDPRLSKNAKLIPLVRQVTTEMEKKASGTLSPISIGGMVTKLQAARKAALFGVPMILANGMVEGILKGSFRPKTWEPYLPPKSINLTAVNIGSLSLWSRKEGSLWTTAPRKPSCKKGRVYFLPESWQRKGNLAWGIRSSSSTFRNRSLPKDYPTMDPLKLTRSKD